MITCHECGLENPPENQKCARCQAVLPPATDAVIPAGMPTEETETPDLPPADSAPDWLSAITAGEGILADDDTPLPDWLVALEAEDASSDQPYSSAELPAWLAGIRAGEEKILPVDEDHLTELDNLADILQPPPAADAEPEPAVPATEAELAPEGGPESPAGPVSPPTDQKTGSQTITGELTNVPPQLVGDILPDWLQDNPLQVDVQAEEPAVEEAPSWVQPAEEDMDDDLFALDEAEAAALASSGEWAALLEDLPATDTPMPAKDSLNMAEIPEWLDALRPTVATGEIAEEAAERVSEPAPETGPLAGFAGVIQIEPAATLPRIAEQSPVAFSISPEQRRQVALLRQLTSADHDSPVMVSPTQKKDVPSPLRIVLGFLLLAVVVIGLFLPPPVETALPAAPATLPIPEVMAAATDRPVLVAFEYTPAMAGELTPQAATLMAELAAQNSPVMLVSQSASGITIGEETARTVNNLQHETLALIPGETVGLRQLGTCIADPADCSTLYGQSLTADQRTALANLGLIRVFAAERGGLVSWMEQVSPLVEVPIVAGVTQALAPVAQPYFNSEQVQGFIGGFPAAAAYEQAIGQDGPNSERVWAVTLAQWIAVAALIVGNIFWLTQYSRTPDDND
jgi:hypothetical protein